MRLRLLAAGLAAYAVSAAGADAEPRKLTCLGQRVTIVGTNRSEVLRGTPRPDVIAARAGADLVFAGGGADLVCGGPGRDRLDGGFGSNRIDGGSGDGDIVTYASASGSVVVDLTAGRTTGAAADRLLRVEVVVGSRFADRLSGSATHNVLWGAGGDDILIYGGPGSDRYEGGAGSDTISFFALPTRVAVDLEDGAVWDDGLVRIENIIGTQYDDLLRGSTAPNRIDAGPGRDYIYGHAGDDVLLGGDGHDIFYPGAGSDYVDGQGDLDLVEYIWETPYADWGTAIDASLTTGRATDRTGTDVLVSLAGLHGTRESDRLEGSEEGNSLWGGPGGQDFLYGRGGDDHLASGEFLDGGPGTDFCIGGDFYRDCELPAP
jgi:serralysin